MMVIFEGIRQISMPNWLIAGFLRALVLGLAFLFQPSREFGGLLSD
ncbi:hypothetical protein [Bifidobacterium moukalabense]|nr:hypothetical protein [Bifidobacterium moukalabense]